MRRPVRSCWENPWPWMADHPVWFRLRILLDPDSPTGYPSERSPWLSKLYGVRTWIVFAAINAQHGNFRIIHAYYRLAVLFYYRNSLRTRTMHKEMMFELFFIGYYCFNNALQSSFRLYSEGIGWRCIHMSPSLNLLQSHPITSSRSIQRTQLSFLCLQQ